MNATKRKFNALLQGLSTQPQAERSTPTKASSTPPSTLSKSAYADDLLKRRRLGSTSDTSPSRLPTTTLKAAQTTSKTDSSGSNHGHHQGPLVKYCPSDREELLRRLATFQEITEWTPKPDKVSEVEWAKKGWVCQGKERVRCVLCARELVVKLNRKELDDGKEANVLASSEIGAVGLARAANTISGANTRVEDALVGKYVELMVTAHQSDCLWRKQGCDGGMPSPPSPSRDPNQRRLA